MKKILVCALFAALAMPALAGIDSGIDEGMTHLFITGGAAMPITEYSSEFTSAGRSIDYGDSGMSYGAQIINYPAKHLGLGLEFNGTNYGSQSNSFTVSGAQDKYTTSADRYSFFAAAKIVANPDDKTRFYIPLGAGFSRFKASIKEVYAPDGIDDTYKPSCTKPAFYAGFGVESDLNDIFLFGFEARYNGFWIDKDKFSQNDSYLDDASLLLKFGIKF